MNQIIYNFNSFDLKFNSTQQNHLNKISTITHRDPFKRRAFLRDFTDAVCPTGRSAHPRPQQISANKYIRGLKLRKACVAPVIGYRGPLLLSHPSLAPHRHTHYRRSWVHNHGETTAFMVLTP